MTDAFIALAKTGVVQCSLSVAMFHTLAEEIHAPTNALSSSRQGELVKSLGEILPTVMPFLTDALVSQAERNAGLAQAALHALGVYVDWASSKIGSILLRPPSRTLLAGGEAEAEGASELLLQLPPPLHNKFVPLDCGPCGIQLG